MEKVSAALMVMLFFLGFVIAFPTARCTDQRPEAVEAWFNNLPNAVEALAKLHFYFHDTVSGKHPSAITVAKADISSTSPTGFGVVKMIDNPLTLGPEPDSRIIGRAQGLYAGASFEEIGLLMTLNLVFTEGEFNGSTLSVLAHNPVRHKYREMPIVGGSGVFRLARGIATAQTTWVNFTSKDAIVEYNVVVFYYVTNSIMFN